MKRFWLFLILSAGAFLLSADEKNISSGDPDDNTAKSAVVFAYLYDRIPGASREPGAEIVIVDPGKVKLYDFKQLPGNLIVHVVRDGKVYSGVDFSEKDGKLVLRGYEIESMEFPEKNASDLKYRVGSRENISHTYKEFFRSDIVKIASERLKSLSEKE